MFSKLFTHKLVPTAKTCFLQPTHEG